MKESWSLQSLAMAMISFSLVEEGRWEVKARREHFFFFYESSLDNLCVRTQKVGEKGFSVASRNLNNLPPLSESSFPSQIHRSLIFIPPSHLSWQEGTKGKNTVINLFHHGNLVENHLVVLHKHSSSSPLSLSPLPTRNLCFGRVLYG